MRVSMPPDIRKFRSAVIPGAIFIFVGGISGLVCLILIIDGWHIDGRAFAFASIFALAFSFFWSWLISFFFPAGFSADGIYGHSFWGHRRFISWHEIATVRNFRLGNLRWLRVYSADGSITWLALFQSRGAEFRQEIRRLAPPSSPVLNYL